MRRSLWLLVICLWVGAAFAQAPRPPIDKLRNLTDVNVPSPSDKDVLSFDSATQKWKNSAAGAGTGTVTNFSAGTLSPIFTTGVTNPTTTPNLTFTLSNAGAHSFLGNNTGSSGAPSYVQPAFSDLSGTATLTQIGATTVGGNLLTLTNPSAITFLRLNGDNTVSALSAANFKTSLSLTSSDVGLGNVTNDVQAKASIYPNAQPLEAQILIGNAGLAYAKQTLTGNGATISLNSTGTLSISAIPNATLTNSSITIAGTGVSLGGSITQDTITGLASTGIVKRTAANTLGIAASGTDYEVPLTFSQSLNRATNTVTLLNDATSPGNSQYYGTNATGTKGYFALPSGGGNVSNSGTPTVDQTAVWTDATHIKGVTTLKGGTGSQVLTKSTGTDYDWAWVTPGTGGNVSTSGTITAGQLAEWTDATHIRSDTTAQARTAIGATSIGSNFITLSSLAAITFARINADNTITLQNANDFKISLGATSVGINIFGLTNPNAVRFLRINADNSVTARTAGELVGDLSLVIGTNVEAWDTQLDSLAGLSYTGNSLKVVRVNSGETGFELATVTSGGAPGGLDTQVQYRVNSTTFGGITNATSDGTTMTLNEPKIVSSLLDTNGNKILSLSPVGSAVNYLDITNSVGDPTTVTMSAVGTAASINIDVAPKAGAFEVKDEASWSGHSEVLRLYHNRSAGGLNGLGTDIIVGGQTTTTPNVEMGGFQFEWQDATHATRSSNLRLATVTNGVFNPWVQLFPTGGLSVRTDSVWTTDPGGGYISVENGYKIGATNIFPVTTARGGVPAGGTINQVLQKVSGTDYDVGWTTASGGGNVSNSGTPTAGQTAVWTDSTHIQGVTSLSGGTTGQVLKKSTNTDYDYAWGAAGSGSPGGNNTEFQYNNGGAFGGISAFTYDGTIPGTITLTPGANTVVTGLFERNTAAATVGNPQHSPSLRFQGHSWNLNGNVDATRDWRIYDQNVSAWEGYDALTFDRSTNGGTSWTTLMQLSSYAGGSLYLPFDGGSNAMALSFYSNSAGFWNGPRGVTVAASNTSFIAFGTTIGLGSNVPLGWTTTANDPNTTIDTALGRNAAGIVEVNNGTAGQYRDILTRGLRSNAVTFANAIASPVDGTLQAFTDSTTNTQGATITGGGSNHVVGYYNGTNWIVTSGAGGGGGNVTTSATLTSNALILGNGGVDTKISTGLNSDGAAQLVLGVQNVNAGTIKLISSSATGDLKLGSNTTTAAQTFLFPNASTDLSITGGTGHVLKQTSLGGAITSGTLAASDVGLGNVTNDAQIKSSDFPASSVDSEIALFNSTSGKSIKRATGSGLVKATSGVYSTVTAPTGDVVGTSDTQTLTSKRINPRTNATTSNTNWTPNSDSYDEEIQTALAGDATINAPSGTPVQGQKLILRITANASPHNLTFNGTYTAIGVTIPTSIAASKTIYVGCIYNSTLTRWDVVAVATQA